MPGRDRHVPTTELELINERLRALHQRQVADRAAQRSPTVPRYDPDFPLDAIDGQISLHTGLHTPPPSDKKPYYYADGDWHPFNEVGSGGFPTYADAIEAIPSLWAYWPMADASGGLVDVVAGRNMTAHGTPVYGVPGPFVNEPLLTAVLFDGSSAWFDFAMSVPDGDATFASNHSWTFCAWVYATDESTGFVFDVASVTTDLEYVYKAGGPATLRTGRATHENNSGVNLDPLGSWHFLACTFQGGGVNHIKLYLDDTMIADQSNTDAIAGVADLIIGRGTFGGSFWKGRIAQAAVFTDALSTELAILAGLAGLSGNAPAGQVPTADGAGGSTFAYPTIEVEF